MEFGFRFFSLAIIAVLNLTNAYAAKLLRITAYNVNLKSLKYQVFDMIWISLLMHIMSPVCIYIFWKRAWGPIYLGSSRASYKLLPTTSTVRTSSAVVIQANLILLKWQSYERVCVFPFWAIDYEIYGSPTFFEKNQSKLLVQKMCCPWNKTEFRQKFLHKESAL
jgi:hypothetical protein